MTLRKAMPDDRPRPSGKRTRVLELSAEQRSYHRANMTKPQMAQEEMRRSFKNLGEALDLFRWYDVTGHPEDWLPHAVEAIDGFFAAFLGFQREVNAVVASDPYFAAVRERQDLERIELSQNGAPGAVLEDALRLSVGASVEAASIVCRIVHALDDAEGDDLDGELGGKDETRPGVVQNDITHAEDATPREKESLGNATSDWAEGDGNE